MREKGALPESCRWLFVERLPLLFDKERVERQLKVETWLDLTQLLSEIRDGHEKAHQRVTRYVV
jgi:hypothetical protein